MRRPLFMTAALVLAFSLVSGAALAQNACSSEACASQCPQVLGPPNSSGMRGLTVDQACTNRCFQQAADCRARIGAEQRARDQRDQDQRRRRAEEEDARARNAAAERRRVFEQEAAQQRERAAERARLDRARDEEFRSRQRRDADTQLQQSRRNVAGECVRQCGMMEAHCLGQNPASDNVQSCQRQGNGCRSSCASNPAFLPRSFTAIQPQGRRNSWGGGDRPKGGWNR